MMLLTRVQFTIAKAGIALVAIILGFFAQLLFNPVQKLYARASIAPNTETQSTQTEVGNALKVLGVGAAVVAGVKMLQFGRQGKVKEMEVKRAAEESEKLQKLEEERTRGRERRKMEGVGGFGTVIGSTEQGGEEAWADDALREGLKRRLERLEKGETDENEKEDGEDKRNMRYKPIPDRGMGSMLLERPGEGEEDKEEEKKDDEVTASASSVEMLKRMWSLGEDGDSKSKKPQDKK